MAKAKDAPKLSEQEEARAVLDEYKANLAAKVKAGKSLTKMELEQIQSQASGGGIGSKLWAKTKVELATELGIGRPCLDKWIKKPGAPKAKPNGDWFIPEWRGFIPFSRGHGHTTPIQPPAGGDGQDDIGQPGTVRESLLCQIKAIELDEKAYDFKVKQGLYVLKSEAKDAIRQCNEKVQMELQRRLCHIAPIEYAAVEGAAAECRKINEGHINEVLELLHSGKW